MSKEINFVLNSLDVHNTSKDVKAHKINKSFYKANSILVIHINIQSLTKKVYKLEELLHKMQVQPDFIAVTETWLKPSRTGILNLFCLVYPLPNENTIIYPNFLTGPAQI